MSNGVFFHRCIQLLKKESVKSLENTLENFEHQSLKNFFTIFISSCVRDLKKKTFEISEKHSKLAFQNSKVYKNIPKWKKWTQKKKTRDSKSFECTNQIERETFPFAFWLFPVQHQRKGFKLFLRADSRLFLIIHYNTILLYFPCSKSRPRETMETLSKSKTQYWPYKHRSVNTMHFVAVRWKAVNLSFKFQGPVLLFLS